MYGSWFTVCQLTKLKQTKSISRKQCKHGSYGFFFFRLRTENILENVEYHFLPLPQCFQKVIMLTFWII